MTEDNTSKLTCGFCSGKGRVGEDGFDGDGTPCPVCQETGIVLVGQGATLHLICDGKGKIKMRGPFGKEMVMCPDCHGTGWLAQPSQ